MGGLAVCEVLWREVMGGWKGLLDWELDISCILLGLALCSCIHRREGRSGVENMGTTIWWGTYILLS